MSSFSLCMFKRKFDGKNGFVNQQRVGYGFRRATRNFRRAHYNFLKQLQPLNTVLQIYKW